MAPVLQRHIDAVARYPDPTDATAALAEAIGIDGERILLTNGGSEAIALLAAEWPAGWVDEPDFSLYARHLTTLDRNGPRWRSNPHNPSGRLAADGERADVWDEAFYPLATGRWTRGDGRVALGSLTKLFACPGLRSGYVVAAPAFIARLRHRQPRWSVNGLVCQALPELLEAADLPAWAAVITGLRADLCDLLAAHGLTAEAHEGCWVLVHHAGDLRAELARHGVLVRDCASFGMPGTVRIGVPSPGGLERLSACLRPR